ncbi:hypothetical protein EVAR_63661_1 [Eumeta japonica]|uniref:Uncharacterized protein n=1 Tax=Eumeta variegata TaxID=151549 RepID=A0A4C2ACD9_EUMVA|nr:hypothetical protein EVAR_63661_1 [Eumeta japonica]
MVLRCATMGHSFSLSCRESPKMAEQNVLFNYFGYMQQQPIKPIEDEGASCLMDERQQLDEATARILRNQRALTRALRRIMNEITTEESHESSYYQAKTALMDKYMIELP